jgi:DNA-binding MarR family transcriptional regulator
MPAMSESPASDLQEIHYLIGQALRTLLRLAPDVHATLAHGVGVGITDLTALDRLTSSREPMGVVELGDSLGIRSASATVLVDRLVAAGHLQRRPHPTDGRRRVVRTTQSARDDMLAVLRPLIAGINEVTDRLDADTSSAVLQYLREVCAVLQEFARPRLPEGS